MGEQSATRLQGDRYQHLYSWYELLQLLDKDSPYDQGFVEQEGAGSADDVTLHARQDSSKPTKFVQVKWHVDHRDSYSLVSLTEVLSGTRSLLQKLFDSWKKLSVDGPIEIWLVSNWAAAPDLGSFIHAHNWSLKPELLSCKATSGAGKSLVRWKEQLNAKEKELKAFCSDLRLRLGFAAIRDLEEMVDDRMSRHGLRIGENPGSIAIDLVSKWIELGGPNKRITRDSLIAAIRQRDLFAKKADAPLVSLCVHGWSRRSYDIRPTEELDWTEFFDRQSRRIPSQETWDSELHPQLRKAKAELAKFDAGSFIDLRGKLPLTIILAIGAEFPEVGGYRFRVEQPTRGETYLWRSDAKPSSAKLEVREDPGDPEGRDILALISITGDASADVRNFLQTCPIKFVARVYAQPTSGPGDASVQSDSDASAFAVHTKELIRTLRVKYQAKRTHLILYAPASYCLFLGQRLSALGDIATYERTIEGGYQTSLTLRTG